MDGWPATNAKSQPSSDNDHSTGYHRIMDNNSNPLPIDPTTTETEMTETNTTPAPAPEASTPSASRAPVERRVYLRGLKGHKRVLVLSHGTLYEAGFTVANFDDLGGDECMVTHDSGAASINVTWGNGMVSELGESPVFKADEPRLLWSVDSIAECIAGINDETYKELWSHVPEKGEGPSLEDVMKKLSLEARRNIAASFKGIDDAEKRIKEIEAEMAAEAKAKATGTEG